MSTILFVDDHHAYRTVFAEFLRTLGNTVLEAGSAAEAEHSLERYPGRIDVLIVEAVLTTVNGLEILRRVQPSHPEMRVLFISEESPKDLMRERLLPSGVLFLRKPFEAEQLVTALRELAAPRRAASKTRQSRARRKPRPARTATGS